MQPDSDQFVFCSGVVLHRHQCQQSFGDWMEAIVEFSRALHAMELDLSAFSCLCALTLVNGKRNCFTRYIYSMRILAL